MFKVAFVILHYMTYEDTVECIESILTNVTYTNYEIVVIDNASPNSTGNELKAKYQDFSNITVILNKENLGFAKGNNIGYRYARDNLECNFIALINNDTIIIQKDFIDKMLEVYNQTNYYVFGPDIISLRDGFHQNPVTTTLLNKKALIKYMIKNISLYSLNILRVDDFRVWVKKYLCKGKEQNKDFIINNEYHYRKINVQLHGSCLIFSPLYIEKNNYGLYSNTFMYMEEEILYYLCMSNTMKTVYDPSVTIYHKEDSATNATLSKDSAKRKFIYYNTFKSSFELYKVMKQNKFSK